MKRYNLFTSLILNFLFARGRNSRTALRHPMLSHRHRSYQHLRFPVEAPSTSDIISLCPTPPMRMIVDVFPIRDLRADCPLLQRLGFNLASYRIFFSTFVAVTLVHISSPRFGNTVFRVFQQFKRSLLTLVSKCPD